MVTSFLITKRKEPPLIGRLFKKKAYGKKNSIVMPQQ